MLIEQLEALRQALETYSEIPEERRDWWIRKCIIDVDRLLSTARVAADYLRRQPK